ncbi:gluconate 2-dehydrogenase subunit 3 family protein [Jiella mangrovi]|uniref:Gluconate 2-dehydrogenase subunit 3 family protein n=1 Tax=Jiella mangrovi TaxID=2821407 RepID=A0ABS4BI71_9HYPH|nr:gluconate 2-dehydrogenase subunit 3 family protein [Jiella mangrovi]MBP0616457.1 gluconate 2-dehydrogenase subunit 3 family protein [Jiella mangrovi]
MNRRTFLTTTAVGLVALASGVAQARSISGAVPWEAFAGEPPTPVTPGGWHFFQPREVVLMEAIVDRLIPADDLSPSGRDCGCVVYVDRQLAGSFGEAARLYMKGPFLPGLPTQGYQNSLTPAGRYRAGLAAFDKAVSDTFGGRFETLSPGKQDQALSELETGKLKLSGKVDGKGFFALVLENTMEGFFADPVHGGNRDMASWKMIGFPGARYDYRDWVDQHDKPYPRGPVSILGNIVQAKAG